MWWGWWWYWSPETREWKISQILIQLMDLGPVESRISFHTLCLFFVYVRELNVTQFERYPLLCHMTLSHFNIVLNASLLDIYDIENIRTCDGRSSRISNFKFQTLFGAFWGRNLSKISLLYANFMFLVELRRQVNNVVQCWNYKVNDSDPTQKCYFSPQRRNDT